MTDLLDELIGPEEAAKKRAEWQRDAVRRRLFLTLELCGDMRAASACTCGRCEGPIATGDRIVTAPDGSARVWLPQLLLRRQHTSPRDPRGAATTGTGTGSDRERGEPRAGEPIRQGATVSGLIRHRGNVVVLPAGVELDPSPLQCSAEMHAAFARLAAPVPRERVEAPRVQVHVVRLPRRRRP